MELKIKHTSDDLGGECIKLRQDLDRKADHITSLISDHNNLEKAIAHTSSSNRQTEADLHKLRKTHEYGVNNLVENIKDLEQANYELLMQKEQLEEEHYKKASERKELESLFKNQQQEAFKKEDNNNTQIQRLESELMREKAL